MGLPTCSPTTTRPCSERRVENDDRFTSAAGSRPECASRSAGTRWTAARFPFYTGRGAGKVNAVHVLAASTWLGTLLVLSIIGIRGVLNREPSGTPRAMLFADLVNAFSPLALTAAAFVAATGLTTAW